MTASVAVICSATAPTVYAQSSDTSANEDVIVTIGTRRKDARSAADVIAPVDVTVSYTHLTLPTTPYV